MLVGRLQSKQQSRDCDLARPRLCRRKFNTPVQIERVACSDFAQGRKSAHLAGEQHSDTSLALGFRKLRALSPRCI